MIYVCFLKVNQLFVIIILPPAAGRGGSTAGRTAIGLEAVFRMAAVGVADGVWGDEGGARTGDVGSESTRQGLASGGESIA